MIREAGAVSRQISAIKNLKMINCYRLFGENAPLQGILAWYGDTTINLCSADEHFPLLFDRLVRQYALEVPRSPIICDEYTRRILTAAKGFPPQELEARLSGWRELSSPLFLPKAYSHHFLIPIVKFILEKLHGDEEDALHFEDGCRDWFGQGQLSGQSHGRALHFPYRILQKHNEVYEVRIGNALKPGDLLCAEIAFETERILASFTEDAYLFTGDLLLSLTGEPPVLSCSFRDGKKEIVHYEKECERLEEAKPVARAAALTAGEAADWKAWALPWGGRLFCASGEKEEYRILSAEREGFRISRAAAFRKLAEDEPQILFGTLAFMLYEKDRLAELHLLDMSYPRSSGFFVDQVGKIYGIEEK